MYFTGKDLALIAMVVILIIVSETLFATTTITISILSLRDKLDILCILLLPMSIYVKCEMFFIAGSQTRRSASCTNTSQSTQM